MAASACSNGARRAWYTLFSAVLVWCWFCWCYNVRAVQPAAVVQRAAAPLLGGTLLVTAAMMVYLLNQDMNNSVRIPWLVVTALMPGAGRAAVLVHQRGCRPPNALKSACWIWRGRPAASWRRTKGRGKLALEPTAPARPLWRRYLRGRGGGFPVYENTRRSPTSPAEKPCSLNCCPSWKAPNSTSFWNDHRREG